MKCIKPLLVGLMLGTAAQSQAMQFPEINEQKIASAMSLVSLGVAAYSQLRKGLQDPDAKQLKYQPYIQSFLDNAGMVTDEELKKALFQRDMQINRLTSAFNLMLDDRKDEARAVLLPEPLTEQNTSDADSKS